MIGNPINKDIDVNSSNVDQIKGGVTSQRVADIEAQQILLKILEEMEKMNTQLSIITGEEL